jgi:hypothetical protein
MQARYLQLVNKSINSFSAILRTLRETKYFAFGTFVFLYDQFLKCFLEPVVIITGPISPDLIKGSLAR